YGLNPPHLEVTLVGKDKDDNKKDWTFYVGKESSDKTLLYVNSSDNKDKVFAVPKGKIKDLFFENPNYLRSKRLFDFSETGVKSRINEDHAMRVDSDTYFEPLGKPLSAYGLETDKAAMRIDVIFTEEKEEKKVTNTDILLIGNKVPARKDKGDFYYARLSYD